MDRTRSHRLLGLTVLLGLVLAGVGSSGEEILRDKLNQRIPDVALTDADGKTVALSTLKGKKALVVVFLSFECPVSTGYSSVLAELAKRYESKGVAFVGVNGGVEADAATLAKAATEHRLPFPVLRDPKRAAADAFKADAVPGAFVLDHNLVLRYRGRIDDGYAARLKPNRAVTSHDLKDALDDLLAGKDVRTPATRVIGCPIARPRPTARTGKVTYYRDVLPILQDHCQECHRSGEVGPFALTSYAQAVNWSGEIRDFTRTRKMPPWKLDDGLPMHGERKLSERDIAALAAWADGGTPEGDPRDAPPPRRFVDGWQLGKPDLVLTLDDDFHLGASGQDLYRCFVLPTGLSEDRYVTAVEVRPGNRRIVHHAVLFTDGAGQARKLEERSRARARKKEDDGPGYSVGMSLAFLPGFLPRSGLGGWAPGQVERHLPDGTGFHLPRGSDVVLQLHYHRSGRPETDRTSVGLYFARKPVDRHVQGVVLPGHFLFLPPGAERYRVGGSVWVRQDCHLHTVMPHMHLLGREIKITMTPPGGPTQTLAAIRDWDFNWQETYFLKESIAVKANTRFDIEAVYDNSDRNPANPHRPPRPVFFGLETTDEMCVGFLGMTADKGGRIRFDVQPRIQGLNWGPSWGIPLRGI
jgi:peroxiredoxin